MHFLNGSYFTVYRLFAVEYDLQSGTVFSSTALMFSKHFLVI